MPKKRRLPVSKAFCRSRRNNRRNSRERTRTGKKKPLLQAIQRVLSRERPPPAAGRFDLTFTPKHGSWLNLIEGFFSKFARSVLRHIRVTSKHELKERIMAGIADVNRHPVIHTWSYKLAEVA